MTNKTNETPEKHVKNAGENQVDVARRKAVGKILERSGLLAVMTSPAAKTVIGPILSLGAAPSQAGVINPPPPVLTTRPPLTTTCAPGRIHHFDKVVFKILSDLSGQIPSALIGDVMDLVIESQVSNTENLDARVLNALEAHIYTQYGMPVSLNPDQVQLQIIDVRYQAEACDSPTRTTTTTTTLSPGG